MITLIKGLIQPRRSNNINLYVPSSLASLTELQGKSDKNPLSNFEIFFHTPSVIDSSTRQISKEIDLSKAINMLYLSDNTEYCSLQKICSQTYMRPNHKLSHKEILNKCQRTCDSNKLFIL